jgi:hypothetical protein
MGPGHRPRIKSAGEIRAPEMFTLENNKSTVRHLARVSSSSAADTDKLEALCERLLRAQPQSEPLLKRLLARSHRVGSQPAFAPIKDGRCSACNMTVAIARIQKAKAGEFINCASCITFLYYDQP